MTAVEFLVDQLDGERHLSTNEIQRVIEQAKEMEKEQIKNAFNYAQIDLGMEAEEYYNEIFKSE